MENEDGEEKGKVLVMVEFTHKTSKKIFVLRLNGLSMMFLLK